MIPYRIDFDAIPWESPITGVRQKAIDHGGKRVRLVEYSREMPPHWCEKGHFGYVLEGAFEIEFDDGTHIFEAGDGIFIPDGPEHRHRGTALTDLVRVIFVEDV